MRIRRSERGHGLSVGIDLGTTYSAVARMNAHGRPEVLTNRDGENITPSVVLFDGEQPIVGTMAKRSIEAAPLDTVQFVKRAMGDPAWRFATTASSAYRPEEISALILKRLRLDASDALGGEVTDAVITVPAYFDDAARRATIDAGAIAGLNVRRLLNEPTAAALAYGMRGDRDGLVMAYDLGGGTFDVTVLRITAGRFDIRSTSGDRRLGGFDFDNALMQLLNGRFVEAGGPSLLDGDTAEATLREKAETAKHTLTTVPQVRVTLAADGFTTAIVVTRAELEHATNRLLTRTRDIAEQVLATADLAWADLDRVLLAGGSTRMPMVRDMLEQASGIRPDWSANPDHVVAHGAEIQADLLDRDDEGALETRGWQESASGRRVTIRDVTSQGLGETYHMMRRPAPDAAPIRQDFNHVIIPRNTPIPARGRHTAGTDPGQDGVVITITQGDSEDLDEVRVVGEQSFPVSVYDEFSPFTTILAYDADQTIYVQLKDDTTGELVGTFEITNADTMTPGQVERATDRMRQIAVI